jgi:hypothetical protein
MDSSTTSIPRPVTISDSLMCLIGCVYVLGLVVLDTHEYDGVSVLKCGPECGYFIDCRLDSFDQSAREGLIRFPPFLDTRIIL